MRIYYVMEAQGRRCHVRTALGVDDQAWNGLDRRLREWRRQLEQRHGIPAGVDLPLSDPINPVASCACGCHGQPALPHGAEVVAQGLRVVEDFAVENGGVQVINVCLDRDDVPHCRQVALDRLFNRVNATAAQERSYALTIFGQEPEGMVVRTCERLRNHNPVLCAPAPAATAGTPATFPLTGSSPALYSAPPKLTTCSRLPVWWPAPCCGGRNPATVVTLTVLPTFSPALTAP